MKKKGIFILLLLANMSIFAQDNDLPGGDNPPLGDDGGPPLDDPILASIDAWLVLFALVGIAYAVFYFRNRIKEQGIIR